MAHVILWDWKSIKLVKVWQALNSCRAFLFYDAIFKEGPSFFKRRLVERTGTNRYAIEGLKNARRSARTDAAVWARFSLGTLEEMRGNKARKIIFLGQGMRPLFETMRELNKDLKLVPPKKIRYFIYSSEGRGKPHYQSGEAIDALIKFGIVDRNTKEYQVIDYDAMGHVARFKEEMISAVARLTGERKPDIKISSYPEENIPLAVNQAEQMLRPVRTRKIEQGGVTIIRPFAEGRKQSASEDYLILQEAIALEVQKAANEYRKKSQQR